MRPRSTVTTSSVAGSAEPSPQFLPVLMACRPAGGLLPWKIRTIAWISLTDPGRMTARTSLGLNRLTFLRTFSPCCPASTSARVMLLSPTTWRTSSRDRIETERPAGSSRLFVMDFFCLYPAIEANPCRQVDWLPGSAPVALMWSRKDRHGSGYGDDCANEHARARGPFGGSSAWTPFPPRTAWVHGPIQLLLPPMLESHWSDQG